MATEVITLPQINTEEASLDFEGLRQQGIDAIQRMGSRLWTDFNTHDPGVTILEVLAYAITDLGYRTNFKVADLLTSAPGAPAPLRNFYTLAEVASMKALTVNDYRRLLVDLPGIRNAWLEVAKNSEVDVWLNSSTESLSYYVDGADLERIRLGGLLNVLLEFEIDPKWGDLNDNSLIGNFTVAMPDATVQLDLEFEFPIWEEVPASFDGATLTDISAATVVVIQSEEFGYGVTLTLDGMADEMRIFIRAASNLELLPSSSALGIGLGTFLPGNADVLDLIQQFQAKRAYTQAICKQIHRFLLSHRNLCEDFVHVQPINVQEIKLDLELEIHPQADADLILAHTYFQTELHLSPPIRFQSLEELLDMGRSTAEIFDGPSLMHGFIDEQTLRKHQRRTVVHTSDLLQLYMDIPGVIAVNRLLLSNYIRGTEIGHDAADCLILTAPERFLPRLSFRRTVVTFERGDNYPLPANEMKAQQLLGEMKALQGARRDSAAILDLPEPFGKYRDTEEYLSIQEDFPRVYGIGSFGLPADATNERRGRAKQMKGFLLFFDQLLANYLSQLTNLRRLFALEEPSSGARTYFAHDLYTVPEVQNLLKDFIDTYGSSWDAADWDAYTGSASPYFTALEDMLERRPGYLERRKQFQAHLLARFEEQFTDYALWLWARDASTSNETLVQDTSLFLSNYPSVSAERAAAFNYCPDQPVQVWETDNVSGLEKRVSRLLGLQHVDRFRLSNVMYNYVTYTVIGMGPDVYFELLDASSAVLLGSISYPSEADAQAGVEALLDALRIPSRVITYMDPGGTVTPWDLRVLDENGDVIAGKIAFATEEDALAHLTAIQEFLAVEDNHEGFHVMEKILLRPMAEGDPFLHVFLDPNCADPALVEEWGYLLPVDPEAALPAYNLNDTPPENPNINVSQGQAPDPIEGGGGGGGTGSGGQAGNGRYANPLNTGNGGTSEGGSVPTAEGLPSTEPVNTATGVTSNYATPSTIEPPKDLICECCDCLKIKDPYSFRVCIIVPNWTPKFSDKHFRNLFRETVRREMPAHVYANFYFLNRKQMLDFEQGYEAWSHWKAFTTRELLDIAHAPGFDPATDIQENALENLLDGCDAMCNGYDSEYIIVPLKKTNVFEEGDVVAYIVDADGVTVDARIPDSSTLPDGLQLHPFTGDIIVTDPGAFVPGENIEFDVVTWNSAGERHCHTIKFTWPTDREAVCEHFDGQLASSYEDDDLLLRFTDPDGAIVDYWFSPDPLPLPAGMAFNPTTGEIRVTDASLLAPVSNWQVQLTTVDEFGGITYHDCVLNLLPDTPAEAEVFVNCSTSIPRLVKEMPVIRVTDIDGGIVSVSPGPVNWTALGLRMEIEVARPFPVAVFYLEDPALYQSYILANSAEVAGSSCRSITFNFNVTDAAGATTTLTVTLAFRIDNAPTISYTTPKNIIRYVDGDELAVIRDSADGGIASFNGNNLTLPIAGIVAERVANHTTNEMEISLRVADAAAFKSQVQGSWPLVNGNHFRAFTLETVDVQGSNATVTIELEILRNPGPIYVVQTDKEYGDLAEGDDLVFISDNINGGVKQGNALISGFLLAIETDPITSLKVGKLRVSSPSAVRAFARQNWTRDEASRTYTGLVYYRYLSEMNDIVYAHAPAQIADVQNDLEIFYDGERPDEMYNGMVIARVHPFDPATAVLVDDVIPDGMAMVVSAYEVRIVVTDASIVKQGITAVQIAAQDMDEEDVTHTITLDIPARQINLDYRGVTRGNKDVSWPDLYPGLGNVVFDAPVEVRHGLVTATSTQLQLRMYAIADRMYDPIVVNFTAELSTLDDEPIVGTLTLGASPLPFSALYQATMDHLEAAIAITSADVQQLAVEIGDALRQLDEVAYFNTLSTTGEWEARLADYRAGEYDREFAENIRIDKVCDRILDLRLAATQMESQAGIDLSVLGGLLRLQVEALTFFVGELRTGDLPASNPCAGLLRRLGAMYASFDQE